MMLSQPMLINTSECITMYFPLIDHCLVFLVCMKNTVAVTSFYCSANITAYGEEFWKQLSIQIISFQLA